MEKFMKFTMFEKETKDGRTKTSVQPLLFEEKVKEIALENIEPLFERLKLEE